MHTLFPANIWYRAGPPNVTCASYFPGMRGAAAYEYSWARRQRLAHVRGLLHDGEYLWKVSLGMVALVDCFSVSWGPNWHDVSLFLDAFGRSLWRKVEVVLKPHLIRPRIWDAASPSEICVRTKIRITVERFFTLRIFAP